VPAWDEATIQDELEKGLAACRRGHWGKGLVHLGRVAEAVESGFVPPPLFRSYYGYGLVRFRKRVSEGLELCESAVADEFYQTEGWLNLARAALAAGDRKRASSALEQGLSVDPESPALLALGASMGRRRAPVLPMLSRDNALNKALGKARHKLGGRPTKDATATPERPRGPRKR
jgi:tetratricopeptide (TPR) repeat protein